MTSHSPPLVSVIVPSFNAEKYLRESLDSILAQTYENLEILVLDDCSTDSTAEIAADYADQIRFIPQKQNLGIYDNVNTGIELAEGDLIATYHADDIYLPTIVEKQVEYLQSHPRVGAVFCADIFIDAVGNEYGRVILPPEVDGSRPLDYGAVLNALMRYKNSFLVCPTAMVRASVHREVGVYRQARYRNTGDLEMWLRIAKSYPIAVLDEYLMKYRHTVGASSTKYHHLRTELENYFWIMDEYLEAGGRAVATPNALIEFEAHRSEDRLMAAISHYIKGEQKEGRTVLRDVRWLKIASADQVQSWRLLTLTAAMWVFLRLPRIECLAGRMFQRWHVKRFPNASA